MLLYVVIGACFLRRIYGVMEKIICFVQNEGEELEKFLGQQNDNSEIHLYTSITPVYNFYK